MNQTLLNNLLQGLQFKDPRLYDLLRAMITDLQVIDAAIFPTDQIVSQVEPPVDNTPPDIIGFTYSTNGVNLVFHVANLTPEYAWELRKATNPAVTDWNTGERVLISGNDTVYLDPITPGSYRYMAKLLNVNGEYSANPAVLAFQIPEIGPISITSQVIDNNVLLYWTAPTSVWNIEYYDVQKNGVSLGVVYATFKAIFEVIAGEYEYKIIPYDITGTAGVGSTINVTVNQPPDYELLERYTSDLSGTGVSIVLSGTRLICNYNPLETWENHFTARAWNSPQDQINAGYTFYIQPTMETGTYEEIHDYGTTVGPTIVTINYNYNILDGSGHTITVEMSTSTDNVTYTTPTSGLIQFFDTPFRYLKFKFTLVAIN